LLAERSEACFHFKKAENASSHPRVLASSALDLKTVFALGADDRVLALGARKSKDCAAVGTLAKDVSFAVTELVFLQAEERAELLIFAAALFDLSGEHAANHNDRKRE
jgi:hypothetical protein